MSAITYVNYTCTNTSPQVIDTFDPPTEKIISYKIHVKAGNTTWYSTLDVSHDGINASEQQFALAKSGITPLELTVAIANNSGTVNVTPTSLPLTLEIERTSLECNLYSENTLSGRNILTDNGVGIYFPANNMTLRYSSNNQFVYVNTYLSSNTLGPIVTNDNLITNLSSSNGSVLDTEGNYTVVTSSGYKDNCMYQKIDVKPGALYKLSGNTYYEVGENESFKLEDRSTGESKLLVGSDIASASLGTYIANTTETSFSVVFAATSNTAYVSLGFGDINNKLYVRNFSLKEYVPFHTYDQDKGTLYVKWPAVAAGNTVLAFFSSNSNNKIYVDASNNVYINTINCGSQSTTNKVVVSYNANGIIASLNGNAVITSTSTFNKEVANCVFVSTPYEFAYMSDVVSNTSMVALSNV